MPDKKTCVELSDQEWTLISSALQTQEKIFALQARAGTNADKIKLNDLSALMRRLKHQNPGETKSVCRVSGAWGGFARALFG